MFTDTYQPPVTNYAPTSMEATSSNVPESQEVRNYSMHEQDNDFARWENELKPGTENDFVLGYDEIDPNNPLFNTEKAPTQHGQIAAAEANHDSHNTTYQTQEAVSAAPHMFTIEMAQQSVEQGTANLERLIAIGSRLKYERHTAESN